MYFVSSVCAFRSLEPGLSCILEANLVWFLIIGGMRSSVVCAGRLCFGELCASVGMIVFCTFGYTFRVCKQTPDICDIALH